MSKENNKGKNSEEELIELLSTLEPLSDEDYKMLNELSNLVNPTPRPEVDIVTETGNGF